MNPKLKVSTLYNSPANPMMLMRERAVDPLQPETFEPRMMEIVQALPHINRYNGHTIWPYSVASHSLYCADMAAREHNYTGPHYQLYMLLHDAAEAYLQDIIRPIKRFSTDAYMRAEIRLTEKIMLMIPANNEQREELSAPEFLATVEEIDTRMAVTEVEQLLPVHKNPIPGYDSYAVTLLYHDAKTTRALYVEAITGELRELHGERNP